MRRISRHQGTLGAHNIYRLTKRSEYLPCCKRTDDGWCGKPTPYTLVIEHEDYSSVYPYCVEHLPPWAQRCLKQSH